MSEPVCILIVDDRHENLLALESVLSPLGETIIRASSGEEALREVLRHEFAVILLDAQMPGLDGHETAHLIRQRPRSANTPVIFITGNDWEEKWIASGYAAGAVDYIVKPFEPEILRSKVRVFTRLYRQTKQVENQANELHQRYENQRRLLEQNRLLEQRLAERAAEAEQRAGLLRLLANELTQAEQRERRRVAQVLHDHLQQLLVAARMKINALEDGGSDRAPNELLGEIRELLGECIAETRSLTVELSPPVLFEGGLGPAIEWFSKHVKEKHNLHLDAKVELNVNISDEMRVLLFEIAREFVFNALKHSGVDTVRLRAHLNGETLELQVEDDGRGFDPEILDQRDSKEAFGLFSIRERLKLFDGRLEVNSWPGRGTRLRVVIPLWQTLGSAGEGPNELDAVPSADESIEHAPEGERIRVLLADDHAVLRKGLARLLNSLPDVDVIGEAIAGQTAVELARRNRPDVVIMDVSMPGINGIEATRHIRRELPDISIVGLSTHADETMASVMIGAGAKLYLQKDGPPDQLIKAIRAIKQRRSKVEIQTPNAMGDSGAVA